MFYYREDDNNYNASSVVIDESNYMSIVSEAYFGKTNEILEIENAIHDLRAPYIKNVDHVLNIDTYTPRISNDPNKRKLELAICKAFGFSDANIIINATNIPAIGTESASFCVDIGSKKMKNALRSSSKGFKYDKSANIVFFVNFNTGCLVSSEFTDAELTAILLHEIGHNFSPAIARGVYATAMCPIITWVSLYVSELASDSIKYGDTSRASLGSYIGGMLHQTNIGHQVRTNISRTFTQISNNIAKECPALITLIGGAITFKNITFEFVQSISNLIMSFIVPGYSMIGPSVLSRLIGSVARPSGYEDEKFSDAFATSYGYGAELNSALDKIRSYKAPSTNVIDYVPVISALYEVYMLPFTVVLSGLDEHPVDAARAQSTIKQLKRELATNKSLNPATKKKIQQDIDNIEELYTYHQKKMTKLPKGSDVRNLYQETMFSLFRDTGDFRGKFMATHVYDDIDKAYNATRESLDVYDTKKHIAAIKENADKASALFADLMNF